MHDAQGQCGTGMNGQFVVQAVKMSMNRVWRHAKIGSDSGFGTVIKHATNYLKLALGERQSASNLLPLLFGEFRSL